MCVYIYIYICIHIYIYIERERYTCNIYIYICIASCFARIGKGPAAPIKALGPPPPEACGYTLLYYTIT